MNKWIVVIRDEGKVFINLDHIVGISEGSFEVNDNHRGTITMYGSVIADDSFAAVLTMSFKSHKSCFHTLELIHDFLASPQSRTLEIDMDIAGNLE